MATQPIEQAVQGYTYKRPRRSASDGEFPLGPEQSKTRRDDGSASGSVLRGYLRDLLSTASPDAGGQLTFADVENRHAELLETWTDEVKADLEGLGVNTATVFRLLYDPAGSAAVAGEHPDKDMINAYFAANPDRVRQLGQALQFGKLAASARNGLPEQDMTRPLSAEAMANWYAANMPPQSLFAPGGVVVGAGAAPYKGLDIRV
ncbi:hypothetical protein BerOc1_00687 [Pseudodesulfovibrio hydrargyri]|uniref:Uncharacterized protein n=1 Tax=Pseudodesulfovibrio hydrargyri TaxID=2125990 RepID=A0A1J5N089_9BACT|nr:hypothetical protein [Pseudodesulfovibrio hydrargyri]OIQ52213.1 hypothetical protein BerOc1_00687 [Pseudodesulfovibrio hydrargyri]